MSFGTNGKFALLWLNKLLFSKHISIQNTPLTCVRTKTKITAVFTVANFITVQKSLLYYTHYFFFNSSLRVY